MAAEVTLVVARLVQAAEATLNPSSSQQQRAEAYQFVEELKSQSPLCVHVGLMSFNRKYSPVVRHHGLLLLEHSVKFRWNCMSGEERLHLKDTSLQLLASGTASISDEPPHLKDALARIVVEIIKREWPQQWEQLFPSLDTICKIGAVQTELVLMVLLRLAEDVITMDNNLQVTRRKQITQALHANADHLFMFFIGTLKVNFAMLKELSHRQATEEARIHQRLTEQTLLTLTGYLEWVKIEVLFAEDCILLQMLCLLLDNDDLKTPACECLLLILNRKGKIDQRLPLLKLLSEDAMRVMLSAAQKAASVMYFDEKQYLFLKRLCQVLTNFGVSQLFFMWNEERPRGKPPNFRQYLEATLTFSKHGSLALSHLTSTLWLTFLRNEAITQDEEFQAVLVHLLEIAKGKLLKVGDPSKGDSSWSVFNREDFDSTREFSSMFAQVRGEIMEIIRHVTLLFPVETFVMAADWLLLVVELIHRAGATGAPALPALQDVKLKFEGATCYIEAVMSRLFKVKQIESLLESQANFRNRQVKLLDLAREVLCTLLELRSEDPHISANGVDCLKALYPFLAHVPNLLLEVLKKMFALAVFHMNGDPKGPLNADILHTRRHACGAILSMCKEYGKVLVPAFDQLKQHIQSMFDSKVVTVKDKNTLTDALVYASNFLEDPASRKAFLSELLDPIQKVWLTEKMKQSISSPQALIAYLGLDKDSRTLKEDGDTSERRLQLLSIVCTVESVVKRCSAPKDPVSDASQGPSIGFMPDGTPYVRNPCTEQVLPLLTNILVLMKSVNSLYHPQAKALMFPSYVGALDIHDFDKSAIFALAEATDRPEESFSDPVLRTRNYLYYLTESCYYTLGAAGLAMGHDFYNLPMLAYYIVENVLGTLEHVPNYRMRFVIHAFMKNFIMNCPLCDYSNALTPVVSRFFAFMLQHLEREWQKVRMRQAESHTSKEEDHSEENVESQEIIEDQMVHLVTKDYVDLFSLACTLKKGSRSAGMEVEVDAEAGVSQGDEGETGSKKKEDPYDDKLGPLGTLLLQSEEINQQLLFTVFSCMTWLDSSACQKATRLSMTFIREVLSMCEAAGSTVPAPVFEQLYVQVLKGLQVHDQPFVQTLLCRVGQLMYEMLKPQYPNLHHLLMDCSGCTFEDLQTFEGMLFGEKPATEKRKRDSFKKLVEGIIGKHIGQMFKNEVKIKDLPPIKLPPKEASSLDEQENIGLVELFAPTKAS